MWPYLQETVFVYNGNKNFVKCYKYLCLVNELSPHSSDKRGLQRVSLAQYEKYSRRFLLF